MYKDSSRPKLTGQHKPKRHTVSDQRHQQDRGIVSGRVEQIVHDSSVAGRLSGLTLLSGSRETIDQSIKVSVRNVYVEQQLWVKGG